MAKVSFYLVTYSIRPSNTYEETFQSSAVLTCPELVAFLRKGYSFDSIIPWERPTFINPNITTEETTNDREENPVR